MKMSRAAIIYMPKTASPKNRRILRRHCTIRKEFRLRGCREFFGIKLAGKSGANLILDMKKINTFIAMAVSCIALLIAPDTSIEAKSHSPRKAGQQKKSETEKVIKAREISTEEFNKLVFDMTKAEMPFMSKTPVIVDFTAKWCGPCQRIAPILDELAKEYDGRIAIYKVDVDKNQELAKEFNVRSIPAVLYISGDGKRSMTVGMRDKSKFQKEIETILQVR